MKSNNNELIYDCPEAIYVTRALNRGEPKSNSYSGTETIRINKTTKQEHFLNKFNY